MKIRIKANTLRLRLTKTEVAEFNTEGLVSDSIDFGGRKLIYSIQKSNIDGIDANFNGEFITVSIPNAAVAKWANSDEVGIAGEKTLPNDRQLSILVEKDFQCLKTRPGEDEQDMYDNPLADDKA